MSPPTIHDSDRKAAEEISNYLLTGMHHNTADGKAAVSSIIARHHNAAVKTLIALLRCRVDDWKENRRGMCAMSSARMEEIDAALTALDSRSKPECPTAFEAIATAMLMVTDTDWEKIEEATRARLIATVFSDHDSPSNRVAARSIITNALFDIRDATTRT